MQKKWLVFDQLYDICVVCVMVDDVVVCYVVLGVVYVLWVLVLSEFDDYIVWFKVNDYCLLYIVVVGLEGCIIEVQICIYEMYLQVELGVVVYWKYKEGGKGVEKFFDCKIIWMC